MIRTRKLLLPVLLVFLFCGCIQSLQKTAVSQHWDPAQPQANDTGPGSSSDTVNPNSSNALQADPAVSENNSQALAPVEPAKDDNDTFAKTPEDTNDKGRNATQVDPAAAENQIQTPGPIEHGAGEKNSAETSFSIKEMQTFLDEALDFCQVSQVFWQKGELENAIEALDKAYSLILTIDTYDIPKLIQQKEDLRFMISKRILEIYASRNIVVNGNHNAIPMVMNKHIQAEIDLFTKKGEKKFFIESYKRSGRYRSLIIPALKEAGLPLELFWLPLIESGFKVNALSRARALGLWQFIPSTGYKFGLKRDKYIDERIDPVKSTQAAIAYLKELHQIFGDWATVLAAYNCGEGKVLRVIRSQNINYLDNFWDLYELLPRETARYVPKFMATLHIVSRLDEYGLDSIPVDAPLEYELVEVAKQVHLRNVAKNIGETEKTLRELNPELRYKILPQEKYQLRVPPGKSELLLANLDDIPVSHPPRPAYVYHRVRPGESLSTIASRYRTSVRRIARANNIRRYHFIVAGQKLKIPRRYSTVYRPKRYDQVYDGSASNHVVQSGDSLWIIAKRYGTTTKNIQEENNLSTTNLYIGQVLKIPGRQTESPDSEEFNLYLVKRGDSPFQIAQQHKMSLERFLRINRLTPRSKIYPGQKLYVE